MEDILFTRDARRLTIDGKVYVVIYDKDEDRIEVFDPQEMRVITTIYDIGKRLPRVTGKTKHPLFGFERYYYRDMIDLVRKFMRPHVRILQLAQSSRKVLK